MSTDTDVIEKERTTTKIKKPSKFAVVILNDDETPASLVAEILIQIFDHSAESAENLTYTIHNDGSGIAGIYSYEIAEQKSVETTTVARSNGYPLKNKLEEV